MTPLEFVLRSAIPWTRENYLLSTWPERFVNELKEHRYTQAQIAKAKYQAKRTGYISNAEMPSLTKKGKFKLFTFDLARKQPEVTTARRDLLVFYDIPERARGSRTKFRNCLDLLGFRQVQRSVWLGSGIAEPEIRTAIAHLRLERWVELVEID